MTTVFDPHELHDIFRPLTGQPIEEIIPQLHEALKKRYPGHIQPELRWMLNNAGGAMGAMAFLHASLTEYVLIFGTPIGTEGHSGRFWANDYFYILAGEQWAYGPGDLEKTVYRPGDMHHLPRGTARGYKIPEYCWAIEYAVGLIPTMIPFGFGDMVMSTLDFPSIAQTLSVYGKSCVKQLMRGKI